MSSVKFRGPIFENPGPAMLKAAGPGLKKLGAQIEATVLLNTPTGETGSYKRSIKTLLWRSNRGVSVRSYDKITRKTWLERGTRGGKKLSKANRMWAKGKAKARESNKQGLLADDIAKALT